MAAVDQDGELNFRRPAEGRNRVHRRADGASITRTDLSGEVFVFFSLMSSFATSQDRLKGGKCNQAIACTGLRPSFKRFCRQFERCLTIQSSNAFSKPISAPAFSLSIHLCFKISSRSARNSL